MKHSQEDARVERSVNYEGFRCTPSRRRDFLRVRPSESPEQQRDTCGRLADVVGCDEFFRCAIAPSGAHGENPVLATRLDVVHAITDDHRFRAFQPQAFNDVTDQFTLLVRQFSGRAVDVSGRAQMGPAARGLERIPRELFHVEHGLVTPASVRPGANRLD